jgi:DNA-binding HxlR family transcriptional regulator
MGGSKSSAMQRKSFEGMQCPIARSLERVGEWWSMLILRDAFYGMTRFDEFQESLGIAPNMLSRRLSALVESGLLARRPYQDRPVRYEYVLTQAGEDFRPVLLTLMAWGNRHFAPEGISTRLTDVRTQRVVDPVLVDANTGEQLSRKRHVIQAGPAANERTRAHIELSRERRERRRDDTSFPN